MGLDPKQCAGMIAKSKAIESARKAAKLARYAHTLPTAADIVNENTDNNRPPQSTKPQCPVCNEPLGQDKGEKGNSNRVAIRIKSVRKRLIDPDNLCAKYFIDALRYEGLLRDDDAASVTVEVTQEKGREDLTVITLEYPL